MKFFVNKVRKGTAWGTDRVINSTRGGAPAQILREKIEKRGCALQGPSGGPPGGPLRGAACRLRLQPAQARAEPAENL